MISELDRDADRVRQLVSDTFWAIRQKAIVLVCTFVLAMAALFMTLVPRQDYYQAKALVEVSGGSLDEVLASLRPTSIGLQAALTDAEAIQSPDVLRQVADQLQLANDRDFLDPGPGRLDAIFATIGRSDLVSSPEQRIAEVDAKLAEVAMTTGRSIDEVRDLTLVDKLAAGLSVAPAGQSNVVEISFLSRSPKLAAEVANAVASIYIAGQRERLQNRFHDARAWYADQIEGARKTILDLERERQGRTLDRTRDGISSEAAQAIIGTLTTEIAAVETEVVRERDRLATLTSAAESGDVLTLTAAAELTGDDNIIASVRQIQEAFAADRPGVAADSQGRSLAGGMEKLKRDVETYVAGRSKVLAYREAYLEKLRQQVNDQTTAVSELAVSESEDAVVETEAAVSRERLQTLTSRAAELASSAALASGQTELVSLATLPLAPSSRGLVYRLALAAVGAGFLAVATTLVISLLDGRIGDRARLAAETGLRPGPLLPALTRTRTLNLARRQVTALVDEIDQMLGTRPVRLVSIYATEADPEALAAFAAFRDAFAERYPARRVAMVRADSDETPQEAAVRAAQLVDMPEAIVTGLGSARDAAMGAGGRRAGLPLDIGGFSRSHDNALEARRQDLTILCYAGMPALPAAAAAMKLSDAAVLLAPWRRLTVGDLRTMPELSAIGRAGNAYASLYNAPDHAIRRHR